MRRTKLLLGLLTMTAIACGVWFTEPVAHAFGRRGRSSSVPCTYWAPPCCVQYVYVPVYRDGQQPRRDDRSKKVHFLFIIDTDDRDIGKAIAQESPRLQTLLLSALPRQSLGSFALVAGGRRFSAAEVERAVRDLPVGRNETLFVYANLHGKAEDKGDGPKQGQALQIKGQEL